VSIPLALGRAEKIAASLAPLLERSAADVRTLAADPPRHACSALDQVESCLARIERWQPKLNCFVRVAAEHARTQARSSDRRNRDRGLLDGAPLAHKDMFYRAGEVCTGGSALRSHWIAPQTSEVLMRLDQAGAVDLGRHNMSELAYGVTGHNQAFGDCRNPWNPDYIPGGSSSGSAAAVAAGLCFGALGSDTGGSIRAPSGICGVTGLKTTLGLVSRAGTLPLSRSLDTIGPIARSADDCALIFRALALTDSYSGRVRIGLPRKWIEENCHAEVAAAVLAAADELGRQGVSIADSEMPDIETLSAHCMLIMQTEAAALHAAWLRERPDAYESQTRARLEPGFAIPPEAYAGALRMRRPSLERFCAASLSNADVLMLPVMCTPTPTLAETGRGSGAEGAKAIREITRLLLWVNYLGVPALALPCGFDRRGLPIGLQLIGRPFADPLLLHAGAQYQRATGWHKREIDG
jgi:aspartyl-tRNA(Asn)/glutamyl-tRNA(Gln) amidotransferase subunit A